MRPSTPPPTQPFLARGQQPPSYAALSQTPGPGMR
uniref:Uncharacterized protein n=1 Tax=Peronospora matthiolae TaxID=2874970 RepID=A0AAV1TAW2_9STRA